MPELLLLWTDLLLWLLLVAAALYVGHVVRHRHLLEPWRHVAARRSSTVAAIVLAAYMLLALLDSIHLRPAPGSAASPGAYSMLDVQLTILRQRSEKTYSAPFATHQYTREFVQTPQGPRYQQPRLQHGGAHLQATERGPDVLRRIAVGLLQGLGGSILLGALLLAGLARYGRQSPRRVWAAIRARHTRVPWDVVILTVGGLLTGACIIAALAAGYHVLGTDKVGEDVLYQALKSIRTAVIIGTVTTLIILPLALVLGVSASYFGGWVDDLVQYLYTTLASVPGILLIAATALVGQVYMQTHADQFASLVQRADFRLLLLCLILGLTSWTSLCRLLRGEALKLREIEFVHASRALGQRAWTILAIHIVPNVMHIVMITLVLDFSALVLAEAVLSYVDIGVDPSMHSWGNMINRARLELAREPVVWWSLGAAFCFMLGLVLAANVFADAVRDAFDPRLRGVDV